MSEKFDSWAIVEIMGHQSFAGRVTEQEVAGQAFLRVDVPEIDLGGERHVLAFTKLFGASSIYSITPCSEDVAREAAMRFRQRPVTVVDFARRFDRQLALPGGILDEEEPETESETDDEEWDEC